MSVPAKPVEQHEGHKEKAKRAFDTLSSVSGRTKLSARDREILRSLKEGKSLSELREQYAEERRSERLSLQHLEPATAVQSGQGGSSS